MKPQRIKYVDSDDNTDSDDEDNAKPMTYDEKRQLSLDINKLPGKFCPYLILFLRLPEP